MSDHFPSALVLIGKRRAALRDRIVRLRYIVGWGVTEEREQAEAEVGVLLVRMSELADLMVQLGCFDESIPEDGA